MKICVLVDVYPHPFKPYFDVQFVEWIRAGHELTVYSLARIPQATSPVPVITLKTLREAPLTLLFAVLVRFVTAPLRARTLLATAESLLASIKILALDAQLPAAPPDVFFLHNLAAGARFWFLPAIFPRTPVGLHYHGGEIVGVAAISLADARRAFAGPDLIFSNTRSSILEAVERGAPEDKTRSLPVGFRFEDYPWSGSRTYARGGRFRIISVGRVAQEKGFDIALRALREVRGRNRLDIEYTLVGDGPEMASIRALVQEYGLAERVTFTGALTTQQVITTLREADVLVVPSVPSNTWRENQACVMQESMLMGLVVVAADIGGVSESIPAEMRGLLFAAGNHRQLADNLEGLLLQGILALEELGRRGREFVLGKYDVRALNTFILESLVAAKHSGPTTASGAPYTCLAPR
jgi:glycosyltransferase involved in cell wall biosynthesis